MRRGKVYYKDHLAGIITETNEGEYVFQYDQHYVEIHPDDFITFTMPVTDKPYYKVYSLQERNKIFKYFSQRFRVFFSEIGNGMIGRSKALD